MKETIKIFMYMFIRCVTFCFLVYFCVNVGIQYYDNSKYTNIVIVGLSVAYCLIDIIDTCWKETKKDLDKKK